MAVPLVREARLRPEHGALFPMLPAGAWLPASQVGTRILNWCLTHGPEAAPPMGSRLLSDEHFEFRGGAPRSPAAPLRTRREDQEAASA